MSVVVWDGRYLAADSMRCVDHEYKLTDTGKLVLRDRVTFALVGQFSLYNPLIDWWFAGAKAVDTPSLYRDECAAAVLVLDDGEATYYSTLRPHGLAVTVPFTMGCMGDFARGCVAAGRNAMEAVQLCCDHGVHVCAPVMFFDRENPSKGIVEWTA